MTEAVQAVVTDRPGETEFPVIPVYLAPLAIIARRALRTYVQSLAGMLTVLGTTQLIPFSDLQDMLIKAAGLAIAPTVWAIIQNFLELTAGWDKTKAGFRA